ncbi:MFS transporter [Streptomyces seoulensis]|nr:MFS transporter [Streptomyces seoulensis]
MNDDTDRQRTRERASRSARGGTSPNRAATGAATRPRPARRGTALAVYLASATLVRSASGGAPVGLVSLTLARHPHGGAALGSVLAALLMIPNVAGPWLARRLEGARDTRVLLAVAFAVHGLALAGGSLLLGRAATPVVAALITLGGLATPLMTGGLSSRLAPLVGGDERAQRRAEGWDSATYGVSNVIGPAAVAVLAGVTGPLAAMVALGAAAVLAGLLLVLLPRERGAGGPRGEALTVREALRVVVTRGPLRRVMVATMLTSVSTSGVMVIAVVFGRALHHSAGAGAALGAAYGVGNLCGALLTAVFPLRGEPERLAVRLIGANAVAVGLCAAAPDYAIAVITFALAGATSAVLFTATLAVRSVYAPPAARAQVFVTMAGCKMVAGAAGTALAGTLSGFDPRLALAVGCLVVTAAVGTARLDRRLTRGTPSAPDGAPLPASEAAEESVAPRATPPA